MELMAGGSIHEPIPVCNCIPVYMTVDQGKEKRTIFPFGTISPFGTICADNLCEDNLCEDNLQYDVTMNDSANLPVEQWGKTFNFCDVFYIYIYSATLVKGPVRVL